MVIIRGAVSRNIPQFYRFRENGEGLDCANRSLVRIRPMKVAMSARVVPACVQYCTVLQMGKNRYAWKPMDPAAKAAVAVV
jgi:hypothetical protein